ncbi:MAG: TlpA family protein disulfide reductase [bacterium]|nr:TlpA family protein disulfide reductase [bacterium]
MSYIVALLVAISVMNVNCGGKTDVFTGSWRAALETPGGDLPFMIEIESDSDGNKDAYIINGEERIRFTSLTLTENNIKFGIDHYDSYITADIDESGTKLTGTWTRRGMGGNNTVMDFSAEKGVTKRFINTETSIGPEITEKNISGDWIVDFISRNGTSPGAGIFKQNGNIVTGTFLTTTGDYRYLEGVYENGVMWLSCFDGAHAFLFKAVLDSEGKMTGDFWSRDRFVQNWTAVRGKREMPDAYEITKLTNNDGEFNFSFPDLEGNLVSNADPEFRDKPIMVVVYGTWCPNCNDEAAYLVDLYEKYHDRGLEIVGLANEFTGDFDKDKEMVGKFVERYGIKWTQLIVGIANKQKTTEALQDFNRITSYPTTIFIDRQGSVIKIHTGFSGPATGEHFEDLKNDFEEIIESLLTQ